MLLREGRILSLSANGKVSHLHEAYHCPLCFLFPGSDPGPLHCPSAEPLLPAQALFIAVLSPVPRPAPPPGSLLFLSCWMRFFFKGSLENEVALLMWQQHSECTVASDFLSLSDVSTGSRALPFPLMLVNIFV